MFRPVPSQLMVESIVTTVLVLGHQAEEVPKGYTMCNSKDIF